MLKITRSCLCSWRCCWTDF